MTKVAGTRTLESFGGIYRFTILVVRGRPDCICNSYEREAGATQLLSAQAQQPVRGDDGVVQGVIAEVEGKLQSFRARRGVILATGGFALNREVVAQHAPAYLDCDPVDVSPNDGWGGWQRGACTYWRSKG